MSDDREKISDLSAAICDLVKQRLGIRYKGMDVILALEAAKQFFVMENILQYAASDDRIVAKIASVEKYMSEKGLKREP